MEVFRWPDGPPPPIADSAVTLGVFDGVHVGHQEIIRQVVESAARLGLRSAVITFDRHPEQVLDGPPQPCITSLAHRLHLFEQLGVKVCLVVGFTPDVAEMEAEDFARTVLRDVMGVRLFIVGFDCRFGKARRGDVDLLRRMGRELRLEARVVEPVKVGGEVVSSTAIRSAVSAGDLPRAKRLLGRPFSLLGTVVHGHGRGHSLGFSTANLDVHHELRPREGVYAGWMLDEEWRRAAAVVSVGRQETFEQNADAPVEVEVHVLDESPLLYERDVEVQFVRWLRTQERFDSADALIARIKTDIAQARRALTGGGLQDGC